MYQDLLKQVAAEQAQFGSRLQPPATEAQIHRLMARARAELRAELPAAYLDFLRRNNGFDWNGVVIYASATVPIAGHEDRRIGGLVEMNLSARADERFYDLLVLGSNGMDIYTYRVLTGAFEIYDEIPHELIETVPSFAALMTKALTRSLQSG
jgi:hypothetical protein